MWRWLLAVFILVMAVNVLSDKALPWLNCIGFGRLPGDLNFTLFGRRFQLPLMSTIILCLVALLLARVFK
jgi:hypothetical protein